MSTYRLECSEKAHNELLKLDHYLARTIYAWLRKNLDGCEDPRAQGEPLSKDSSDRWVYRIGGGYEAECEIGDDTVTVLSVAKKQ